MKVHKITMFVLDFDNYGADSMPKIIECDSDLSLTVTDVETIDIGEWDDDNPLNYKNTKKAEFKKLFSN